MFRADRRLRRTAIVLSAAALAASCGGDGQADVAAEPRTIKVVMEDNRFEPERIEVEEGEEVVLEFVNQGTVDHEAFLGDEEEQEAHEADMAAPGSSGDAPGKSGDAPGNGPPADEGDGHGHGGPSEEDGGHGTPPGQKKDKDDHDGSDEGQSISLAPGASGELTFTGTGEETLIGCHVPGHYRDGMVLDVAVG